MPSNTWVDSAKTDGSSRADQDLVGRTNFLKRQLEESQLGERISTSSSVLAPETLVGDAVFWNHVSHRFEPALAVVGESARAIGLVIAKSSSINGTVLLAGKCGFVPSSNASAGLYFLSPANPGKLVNQAPAIAVPILFYDGDTSSYLCINPAWTLERHSHLTFSLFCQPAGHSVQPDANERHTVVADASVAGWLPATHATFRGLAPDRAAFGYNLNLHPSLAAVWPPSPLESASFVWDRGDAHVGGTVVPTGRSGLVQVTEHGIWWMSDCYGDVPWPTATNTSVSSLRVESSISPEPECPRFESMRLTLSFVSSPHADTNALVTSLQSAEEGVFEITDCSGISARTGRLFLSLNVGKLFPGREAAGFEVVKRLPGGDFATGLIIEGIRSLSSSIVLGGTSIRRDGQDFFTGLVTVRDVSGSIVNDITAQFVSVNNAQTDSYRSLMFISLPAGRASEVRIKFAIPSSGYTSPSLVMRLLLLAKTVGNFPNLTLSYRRIPLPSSGAVSLPTSDSALAITTAGSMTADTYKKVESSSIAVTPGDTVYITISRSVDSYNGDIGLLDITGLLRST